MSSVTHSDIPTKDKPSIFSAVPSCVPGVALALAITLAAALIEMQFGGPVMLYALLLGMCASSVAAKPMAKPGISFSANQILRIGVILLGAKVTMGEISELGWQTALAVVAGIAATLTIGWAIGRKLKLSSEHSILSAGAVAICGSSAALAICTVLPRNEDSDRNTAMTVFGVTTLSTLAMVLYPVITSLLGYTPEQAGVFMGLSIHNVAQVVGAGYMVSDDAAATATVVKLMRVACLVPAVVVISLIFRKQCAASSEAKRPPLLPLFLVGFVALMVVNSLGFVSVGVADTMGDVSRWALVISVAAIGAKTSFRDILNVGPNAVSALLLQTAFLAVFAGAVISFLLTV